MRPRAIDNGRRGWTLIEMLIVVAILGIMATGMIGLLVRSLEAQQRTAETLQAIEATSSQLEYLRALNQSQGLHEGAGQSLPLDPARLCSLRNPAGWVDVEEAAFRGVWQVSITLQWGDERRTGKHQLRTFLPRLATQDP